MPPAPQPPAASAAGSATWPSERIDALTGWTLVRAFLVRAPRFHQALQDVGLSPTQFGVLVQLDNSPGLAQAELARRALMTPQSMGEVLVSLERLGHVVRGVRAGRGHPIPVSLTEQGRAALAAATPLVEAVHTPEALGLTPEEDQIVNVLLHKIIRHDAGRRDPRARGEACP
jgi:DNA-binding MarR family transcriptional regulator